mmetsp:Transcript_14906/g.36601  ORF Transcript_14906/g.36601 Transcript_14906/m.36601 type:complete len:213 (+) Transcript_14906:121-759(+)
MPPPPTCWSCGTSSTPSITASPTSAPAVANHVFLGTARPAQHAMTGTAMTVKDDITLACDASQCTRPMLCVRYPSPAQTPSSTPPRKMRLSDWAENNPRRHGENASAARLNLHAEKTVGSTVCPTALRTTMLDPKPAMRMLSMSKPRRRGGNVSQRRRTNGTTPNVAAASTPPSSTLHSGSSGGAANNASRSSSCSCPPSSSRSSPTCDRPR